MNRFYKDFINDQECNTKTVDWVLNNDVFVEYFGMPDKSYYYKKMEVKRLICKRNNKRLIELFFEDLDCLDKKLLNL
jgi:hypothetical protein